MPRNVYTLAEQIKDNAECFGEFAAAKLMVKKVCFTHYYFLRFGQLPRKVGA